MLNLNRQGSEAVHTPAIFEQGIRTLDVPRSYSSFYPEEANGGGRLDLVQYWRLLLKHRLVVLATVIVALGVGLAVILLTTPTFTAGATLQIDKQTAQISSMEGAEVRETIASEEFFQTQYALLKSRSLTERTVDKLDLPNDPAFLKAFAVAPSATLEQRRRALVGAFAANLDVTPVRASRLVNVVFDSTDPVVSARAANGIAENFIDQTLDRRIEASSTYRKLISEQLAKEKENLETSERQLAAYATRQQIINIPGSGSSNNSSTSANQSLMASSLMALTEALAVAKGERIRAESRWRQAQNASGLDVSEVLANETIQTLKQERAKAQAEYDDTVKTYRPEFAPAQQAAARIAALDRQIAIETRNVQNSLKNQYDISLSNERQFDQQVNLLKGSVLDLRGRSIQYDILQREVDTSRQLYEGLLESYKEIGVAGGLKSNNIYIIDRAEPPGGPSKPKPLLIMAAAAMGGLILGVLLAFLLELLDESIRAPEDVENKLGLPLLGTVPKLERGSIPIDALGDIRSAFAESYYSIRTALQFSTNEGVPSSILVTSARPSEGKSTSAIAIATNFARLGTKVLLIDSDMRNPSLHRVVGAENSAGLSNVLTGNASLQQLIQPTSTPDLYFLPCGPLPPNPAELLAGAHIKMMLDEARGTFEVVVIDGPPVMGLADAPMLAAMVAGTVLVIESGGTGRNLARVAIRRLNVGATRILGVLLTKFDAKKSSYGYGYGYGYAYDYDYGSAHPALKGKG